LNTNYQQKSFWEVIKPWLCSIFLLPIGILIILNDGDFIFILDHFNLLIHEGGHGIFRIFGRFIYTLGGTLMQIIIPGLFIFYFSINRKKIGIQIALVWLGQNLLNIGTYAADAVKQQLPLLGGNKVYHDWSYLLRETNLLSKAELVGSIFDWIGILVIVFALILPLFMREYEQVELDLKV
jgi:hypothetical protein